MSSDFAVFSASARVNLRMFAIIFSLISMSWVKVENDVTAYLAEDTEIVVELDGEVTSYDAVPGILGVATTYGAHKGRVLIKEVVDTYEYLALLILEEFLAEVYVADKVILVVLIGKADILVIVNRCGKCEALPEYPLKRS